MYLVFEADHVGLHLHEVLHAVDELRVVPVADPGDLVALLRLELLQRNLPVRMMRYVCGFQRESGGEGRGL